MQSAPKSLLKEYVQSQQFTNTSDIMQAMKEMFRDVIEQVMEVEMDDELGRERCHRSEEQTCPARNYRNGYSKNVLKTSQLSSQLLTQEGYFRDRRKVCEIDGK